MFITALVYYCMCFVLLSILQALEEFHNGVEVAINSVSELVQRSEEVASLCSTVLHYEALRTHTVDAMTWDSSFTKVSVNIF